MQLQPSHIGVMRNIEAGLGAWHGAERPKQRGYRGGLLRALKTAGLIDWTMDGHLARYYVTDAGKAALAAACGQESRPRAQA